MIHVVTTYSQQFAKVYGDRFVRSFLRHWPQDVVLHRFLDFDIKHAGHPQVMEHDLRKDETRTEFLDGFVLPDDPVDYRRQPQKFCHKVFSYTSPELPQTGWRLWIDADVETTSEVSEEWLDHLLDPSLDVIYLGRHEKWYHSETGFLAFNLDRRGPELLAKIRKLYLDRSILNELHKHDSRAFDIALQTTVGVMDGSLSEPLDGSHVWPDTVLGEVMVHSKGPLRKLRTYGPQPSNLARPD